MKTPSLIWLFFSFSGRISRGAYFLAGLLMMVAVLFIFYQLMLAEGVNEERFAFWEVVLSIGTLVSLWAQAALGAKRFHDFGKPGLFAAVLFVPAFNFIAFVALSVIPGQQGPNGYGQVTNRPA